MDKLFKTCLCNSKPFSFYKYLLFISYNGVGNSYEYSRAYSRYRVIIRNAQGVRVVMLMSQDSISVSSWKSISIPPKELKID